MVTAEGWCITATDALLNRGGFQIKADSDRYPPDLEKLALVRFETTGGHGLTSPALCPES
jgi:hypothetical protein